MNLQRLEAFIRRFSYARLPHRFRLIALVAALALFIPGLIHSVRSLRDVAFDLPLLLLAVALGLIPQMLSAAEVRFLSDNAGRHLSWKDATDIAITGKALNVLPLPGGSFLRTSYLAGLSKVSMRTAVATPLALSLLWVSTASLVAGASYLLLRAHGLLSVVLLTGGLGGSVLSLALLLRNSELSKTQVVGRSLAIEYSFVLLSGLRMAIVLAAIGSPLGWGVGLVLALAGPVSIVIGLVPAGLGVREWVAAGLAESVGLAASVGFLASAVLRLTTIASALIVGAVGVAVGYLRPKPTRVES